MANTYLTLGIFIVSINALMLLRYLCGGMMLNWPYSIQILTKTL